MINNTFKTFTILSVCILLSGCIGFRGNNVPEINKKDLQFSGSKKTKVFTKWEFYPDPDKNTLAAELHKKAFEKTLTESECCNVIDSRDSADIIINGKTYNESSMIGMPFAVLTGLSLYTIPSWITAKQRVVIEVNKGKKSSSYELKDSMLMVQWLPFIVTLPFRENPIKMEQHMQENLYGNFIVKMREDGYLNKK